MFRHTHIIGYYWRYCFPRHICFLEKILNRFTAAFRESAGDLLCQSLCQPRVMWKEILTVKKVGRHSRNLPPPHSLSLSLSLSLSPSLPPLHPEKYLCSLTHNHTTHYVHYMTSHSIPLQACTNTNTPYEFVYIYINITMYIIYIYIYKTVVSSN